MIENVPVIAAMVAIVGLFVALMLYRKNDAIEIDNEKVAEITKRFRKGLWPSSCQNTNTSPYS